MKHSGVVIALSMLSLSIQARAQAPLRVEVTFEPPRVLLGCPVGAEVRVTNVTSLPANAPAAQGGSIALALRWELTGGEGVLPAQGPPTSTAVVSAEPLEPGKTRTYRLDAWGQHNLLPRFRSPGTYRLRVVLSTEGVRVNGGGTGFSEARSDEQTLEIVEPTGEDAQAYQHLVEYIYSKAPRLLEQDAPVHVLSTVLWGSPVLLSRVPTSTYAAFAVWRISHARDLSGWRAGDFLHSLTRGPQGIAPISVPCFEPGCAMTTWSRSGLAAVAWREEWFGIVLKAHPDIFFADELRLLFAVDRFLAGAPQTGAAELEALAKGGRADIAAKAAELLQLVREKGLVK